MTKYFRRFRQDNTLFYIDEMGNEVDEATAKLNLVTESQGRHTIAESARKREVQKELQERLLKSRANLYEAFRRFGLSDVEARIAAEGRQR